jgi:hypothetical protein
MTIEVSVTIKSLALCCKFVCIFDNKNLPKSLIHKIGVNTKKIFWTNKSIENLEDLHLLTDSADLGVALYNYSEGNALTGRNIKYIGLASGKIAMYMSFGLPILTNVLTNEYAKLITKYKLGLVVNTIGEIPEVLSNFDNSIDYSDNCITFFEKELNLSNYQKIIIDTIDNSISFAGRKPSRLKIGVLFKVTLLITKILKKMYYRDNAF